MCSDSENSIYVVRHGSPLLIGENEDSVIVASEVSGFNNLINNYIILDNNDLVIIDDNGYKSNKKNILLYETQIVDKQYYNKTPAPYDHWMIKEINEQMLSGLSPVFNGSEAGLTEENLQARIRGNILMAAANKQGALLLNTGNKNL